MGRGDHLGELEHLVLLAVVALSDEAYGVRIRDEITERAGRTATAPTIYSTLDRLEEKGLVSSEMGDPTPERGGRAKKYFRIEAPGIEALRVARRQIDRMWAAAGLEPAGGEGS